MGKFLKVLFIIFLICLVNAAIFGCIYLKNNVFVSIFITGNKYTSNNLILEKFENNSDIFYWYLKRSEIIGNIKELPFVKDVEISPVSLREFYKININIKEEKPYFLFKRQDGVVKIVSKKGSMIASLDPKVLYQNNDISFKEYPIVLGVDEGLDNFEKLNSRLIYLSNFIQKLRKKIKKYKIYSISYLKSGDVIITFKELRPTVVMDISKGDGFIDMQIDNLVALQQREDLNIESLSQIDLAYEKQAVLKH